MSRIIALVLIVVAGWYGYSHYQSRRVVPQVVATPNVTTLLVAPPAVDTRFKCDGRTHCSQMTSCEEATYFLRYCPGTQMDGDNDGVPCEKQYCR